MGTQLKSIITAKNITIEDLSNKKLAVDTFNMLYQFMSSIRQYDGSLLVDSKGNVTSHLSGLFFRITKLMKHDIKLAFVFDGQPPELKKRERERRKALKKDAQQKYELAVKEQDFELMKKYASRAVMITAEIIEESKELIAALGHPIIQAPSEGEAQAAYVVRKENFFAVLSQDTDALLFGSPRIIKNVSITGRRKRGAGTEQVHPEIINLQDVLNNLSIDIEQLVVIAMLCGTDFNIGGIIGIGPRKALELVKKHRKDFNGLFEDVNWDNSFDFSWRAVYNTIMNMPTTGDYEVKWNSIDTKKVLDIMVNNHDFSKDRIEKSLHDLINKQSQKNLSDF